VADNIIARKNADWQANSVLPDVSKTPMGGVMLPVPYPVTSPLAQSQGTVGTVLANKDQVWGFSPTKVPVTQGDEAGTGKGVKSGTVAKDTYPMEKSSTVKAEKTEVIRNDDKVEMNGDKLSKEEEEKAKRQKCREEQVKAGQQSENPAVRAAADRLSRNMKSMEHAKLSDHVYDPSRPAPAGWRNISNDPEALRRYGLTQHELGIHGTDFRAQVYEPNSAVFGSNGDYRPTVVFQGTNGARSGSDWSNNLRQSTNFHSPYYQRAVGIGNVVRATGSQVDFAGHSLGGGLASAASQASGRFATTFNAAGLHSRTVPGYGRQFGDPSMVNAYHVRGDILTNAQEGSWWQAVLFPLRGLQTWATPDAIGNKFSLPGHGTPLARHDMSQVMEGIEGEKQQDQATIAKDTGKEC
jgi:hypothetical protein